MTRVLAPSRLHFGLISLPALGRECWPGVDGSPGLPIRRFGGVGLMVVEPPVVLRVRPAAEWSASGPNGDRALEFARRFTSALPIEHQRPFLVEVEQFPGMHRGLGGGTALGLSVARAIAVETGNANWTSTELAVRVGRGERSAVGVHGFEHGGLVVEAGKLPGEAIAPLLWHSVVPTDWRVVLVSPDSESPWHGETEQRAFADPRNANSEETLCRIVMTGLLPALKSRDSVAFGEALYEYNRRAGAGFTSRQGGAYSTREGEQLIAKLRSWGVRGVGQSSWGPTIFAFTADTDEAERVRGRIANETGFPKNARITRACSTGAIHASGNGTEMSKG